MPTKQSSVIRSLAPPSRILSEIPEDALAYIPVSRQPSRIVKAKTVQIYTGLKYATVQKYRTLLELQGWEFFCVEQTRGRCYYLDRRITIPAWAFQHKDPEYWIYYLSHEMAHAFIGYAAGLGQPHGTKFMEMFKDICPVNLRHYELEYMPKMAKAAGISEFDAIRDDEL